jgi:hypothetical protein
MSDNLPRRVRSRIRKAISMNVGTIGAREMAEHEHEIQMDRFEAMTRHEMHPELAVAAAMHYCATHAMPVPQWLAMAATKLLCRLIGNRTPKKRGRAVSPAARYVRDQIDYERWDVVRETRAKQVEVKGQLEELKKIPTAPRAMVQERQRMHDWAREDWLNAFQCASMQLKGSVAEAGPEAIKKSYQTYQRKGRGRISSLQYYRFDPALLCELGITIDFTNRSKKVRALYSLTL